MPAPTTKTDKPNYVDEDIQFTVFQPKTVRPEQWYDLVAAAHLEEKRETAEEDEAEPLEKVRRKARKILGVQMADYNEVTRDSTQSVPQCGEITFLFEMDKVEFNPGRCTFQWLEDEPTVDVRIRPSQKLDERTATGQMCIFLGAIVLLDVPQKIKVDSRFVSKEQNPESEPVSARPHRKIFASYSHQDLMIVEQFERFAEALGDRYLRDWKDLRAGENWDARLMQLIEEADVFQLFWSRHAMESPLVRREWEYALGLARANFVRPVYWEQPFPRRPDLPTPDLARLHFQHLTAGDAPHVPAASEVQNAFVPQPPPRLDAYEFFDCYALVEQRGMNYYDYIRMPDGRLAIVVAGVRQSGDAVAMLMRWLSDETKRCLMQESQLTVAIKELNNRLCALGLESPFIYLIMAVLDARNHKITMVNAGTNLPIWCDVKGNAEFVGSDCTGLPIGLIPDREYEQTLISLSPGESLTMFTDGIPETMDLAGQMFGSGRILRRIQMGHSGAEQIGRAIIDDLHNFRDGGPQLDDECLVCVRRKER